LTVRSRLGLKTIDLYYVHFSLPLIDVGMFAQGLVEAVKSGKYNAIATYIICKVISFIVPLRMDEATLKVGDDAVHGETAYAIGKEGE
jgi:ammonia channel protein AmtB